MKQLLLLTTAVFAFVAAMAQTTYRLELVAEGNFGSPTGDVFVRNTTVNPATNSTGAYQAANSTTGFDVLQDYQIAGNKAIFIEKPAGAGRIVIANYPSMTNIHTFNITNAAQTIGVASATKAYVSYGNPGDMVCVDLVANTLTPVTDPGNAISSYSNHMVYAHGFMFAQIGENIIKIDTATNAVAGTISPAVGSISGIAADAAGEKLWVMGGGTLKSIDLLNGDLVSAAITVGPTSSAHVRFYNGKIYFWSFKDLFIYDIANPVLPLTAVYTSTLVGQSWSFGYGRSFDIDETTGDFVIGSANNFSAPGYFEVVDGTAFTVIESSSMPGCAIPNNCVLKTYHNTPTAPVPTVDPLPQVTAECSTTLTAPTATGSSGTVTGTTSDPVSYTAQGTYTVTWTYTDNGLTATQTQTVVIDDTTDPVATVAPSVEADCNETITAPTATDNCTGTVTGTTTDPVSYSEEGTYTITWTFADGNGNTVTETQQVVVSCPLGLEETVQLPVVVYPNPANTTLTIELPTAINGELTVTDMNGRTVQTVTVAGSQTVADVSALPEGLYFLQTGTATVRFTITHH